MSLFRRKKQLNVPALGGKDIHNHILPGMDDGFSSVLKSVEALRRMKGAGIREVVFTPHLNPDVYPEVDEAAISKAYDNFICLIPRDLGIKTSFAAEYMIVKDFEKRAADDSLLLLDDDGSILVEMSYFFRSPNLEQTIFELSMAGRKPILAHPERYLYMADKLGDFDSLADAGCRFQLNLMSLTGVYGPKSRKILNYLSDKGMYSFAATDLHSLTQLESIFKSNLL